MTSPDRREAGRIDFDVDGLLARSGDALYRYRLESPPGFEFVSDGIEAIVGYTAQEHYDDPHLGMRIAYHDDRDVVARALAGELDRPRVLMRWVHRDGRTVWTEQLLHLERRDGRVVAIEGAVRLVDGPRAEHEVAVGTLVLDLTAARVVVDGRKVALTPSEHRILSLLAVREDVVTREELLRQLWDTDYSADDRVLDVHVSNLRRKLAAGTDDGPSPIETVRRRGYRLRR